MAGTEGKDNMFQQIAEALGKSEAQLYADIARHTEAAANRGEAWARDLLTAIRDEEAAARESARRQGGNT